jgi:mRNA interferase RelE/StbE
MGYRIEWSASAAKKFDELDNTLKKQIAKTLQKLEERDDPRTFGKPLQSNLAGLWRYRVGNMRLITEIQDAKMVVLVLTLNKRDVVYK